MQIITLTVIWDQSSSVITFTTPRPWQNKQIAARCETGRLGLQHYSYCVIILSLVSWSFLMTPIQLRWPHASLGCCLAANVANVMTQEIYCGHKNGEIGSGGLGWAWLTQSDPGHQGRVLEREFRKLSQTSLETVEIIHNIDRDININWHWQGNDIDKNTIDYCLDIEFYIYFKKNAHEKNPCRDELHFWRKVFLSRTKKVSCWTECK